MTSKGSYQALGKEDDYAGRKSEIAQQVLDAAKDHAKSVMQAVEELSGEFSKDDVKVIIDNLASEQIHDLLEFINDQDGDTGAAWSFPKGVKLSFQNIFYRYGGDNEVYLSGISGYVKPGEMLLMLGAPDSQMDTLLRVLAKRTVDGEVYGNIMLNGLLPGADYKRKIAYVPKIEICIPTITVQETVYTSYRLRMDPETPEPAVLLRVLLVLKIFGILRVRDTIVGDPIVIRGVSGGERRRLTFCQEVGGFASLLMADLPTNGLDSATAYNLCKTCQTACRTLNLSVIFCLAQPSNELIKLFDNLLLLAKGRQIYFGPLEEGIDYFESIGYHKPELKSIPDFYQELTGDPRQFYNAEQDQRNRDKLDYTSQAGSWQDLAESWRMSDYNTRLGDTMWSDFPIEIAKTKVDGGMDQMSSSLVMAPLSLQFTTLWKRQLLTVLRNPQFSKLRVAQVIMFSLIISLTWFDQGHNADTDVLPKFSSLFMNIMFMVFSIFPALPFFCFLRNVHAFQVNSEYYNAGMFYVAFQMVEVLWIIPETLISSIIIYSMQDLNGDPLISEKWLFNWLTIVTVKSFGSAMALTWVAIWNGDSEVSHATFPVTLYILLVSSGMVIARDDMLYPWKFFWFINPLQYGFRGNSLNEFYGSTYSGDVACTQQQFDDPSITECNKATDSLRIHVDGIAGDSFLYLFDLHAPESDKWLFLLIAVVIVSFWHFLGMTLTSISTREVFVPTMLIEDYDVKTQRKQDKEKENSLETYQNQHTGLKVQERKFKKLIPRILISWKGLNYGVDLVNDKNEPYFKHILHDCFGYAEPGKVIALMGATGAGKSTLMDVLADYKTIGKEWGEIRVNGIERTPESNIAKIFHMVAGYCEQFDSHEGSMTVRQAIEFSATLRLPTNLSDDELQDRVDDVLEKLQLVPLQDFMIGDEHSGGISPEYRKKVTIGVELVMDPGLLFLDEPTTGLDSASALNVMTCVKGLADDMSIVCTIHQPSIEVFAVFDQMMLLKQGGLVCYFGDVEKMADYFSDAGLGEWNGVQNIADFALDCSYAKSDSGKPSDELFLEHQRYQDAMDGLEKNNSGLEEPTIDWNLRPSFWDQTKAIFWRDYNRNFVSNTWFTKMRLISLTIVGCIVGWVFYSPDISQSGTNARVATCFMSLSLTGFFCQQHIPFLIGQRGYVFREKKANMYNPVSLVLSRQLVEFPMYLLESFCLTIPVHFLTDMRGNFFRFWLAWILAYMCNVSCCEFGVSLSRDQESADASLAMINTLNFMFSGYLIQEEKIPIYFKPLHYASLIHYGFFAIALNEFESIDEIPPDEEGTSVFSSGDQVISYYNVDQLEFFEYLLIFVCFTVLFKALTFVSFSKIEHIKR